MKSNLWNSQTAGKDMELPLYAPFILKMAGNYVHMRKNRFLRRPQYLTIATDNLPLLNARVLDMRRKKYKLVPNKKTGNSFYTWKGKNAQDIKKAIVARAKGLKVP